MNVVDRLPLRRSRSTGPGAKRVVVAAPVIVRPADVLEWMGATVWHLEEVEKLDVNFLGQLRSCPPELVVESAIANVLDALPVARSLATVRHTGPIRMVRPIVIGEPVRPVAVVRQSSRYGADWVHLTLGIELLDGRGSLRAAVQVGVEVVIRRLLSTAERSVARESRTDSFGMV